MGFVFDSTKKGLETVFRGYQMIAIRLLWERGKEGIISKDVWLHVNKILLESGKSISRASIINYLNDMVEQGILRYTERSGKGGFHRVYTPVHDESGFKEFLVKQLIEKLLEEFPDETNKAISKIRDKT